MFSVNNFYDFFISEYGHEKTNNFVMTYQPHGSKDLHNLEPYGVKLASTNGQENFKQFKRIVMHDQEPLFLGYVDTYRRTLDSQKNLYVKNDNQNRVLKHLQKNANNSDVFAFIRLLMKDHSIICHSEKNSKDIEMLNQHGFIDCYYWWHGMIARDWFRHWEHYQDLAVTDKSAQQRFLLYSRAFDGTRAYRKELLEHCKKHQDLVRYNWSGNQVDSTYSAKIDIPDAVNSAVHIVAETLFDTEKVHLTEKVFKPMVMSQAFILFAPPGSLQYLKDYGFKTFDSCWDESYDHEIDSAKRMTQLLALIDHIAGLSQQQFQDIYQRAMPIIEHNRKRFFSTAFQEELILEMCTNMEKALLKQNQSHEHSLDNESSANGDNV